MVLKVNSTNFEEEVLKFEQPVMVDFYADWCMPCKSLEPIIEKVSETHKVVKLNVDESHAIAAEFKIKTIPTLIVFKKGAPYKIQIGRTSIENIVKLFD